MHSIFYKINFYLFVDQLSMRCLGLLKEYHREVQVLKKLAQRVDSDSDGISMSDPSSDESDNDDGDDDDANVDMDMDSSSISSSDSWDHEYFGGDGPEWNDPIDNVLSDEEDAAVEQAGDAEEGSDNEHVQLMDLLKLLGPPPPY
jgi:hypothetical protein